MVLLIWIKNSPQFAHKCRTYGCVPQMGIQKGSQLLGLHTYSVPPLLKYSHVFVYWLPSRNFCVRERMRTTKHHWYKPSFRVLLLKSSISNDVVQVLMDRKEIEGDSIINNDMNGIVSRRPPHNTSVGSNNREIFVVLLLHKQIWCHF